MTYKYFVSYAYGKGFGSINVNLDSAWDETSGRAVAEYIDKVNDPDGLGRCVVLNFQKIKAAS